MRFSLLAAALMASSLASLMQGGKARAAVPPQNPGYEQQILNNPMSGDDFAVRNAIHAKAQARADAMFSAVAGLLGGTSPRFNFVATGNPLTWNHMSANGTSDHFWAPRGTINMDPYATAALTNDASGDHSLAVNQVPHEQSHTRQVPSVLASISDREGGAQAFADVVAQHAAQQAGIPYSPGAPGEFDGSYAGYVKAAQAKGLAWILGSQFTGQPGPTTWP